MHQFTPTQHYSAGSYSHQWHPSEASSPSSASSSYAQDSPMEISNDSYPQTYVNDSESPFQKTLLEYEENFYKTFPAAAHAIQRWGTTTGGGGCDDHSILFFSQPSEGNNMDMDAAQGLSSQPAAFASAPTGRNSVTSDVLMGDSVIPHSSFVAHLTPKHHAQFSPTSSIGRQVAYSPTSGSLLASPASSPYTSDLVQATLASPGSTASSNSLSGSLPDANHFQSNLRDARNHYASSYVNSGSSSDDGQAPMASLSLPPNLSHASPAPLQTASSSLSHYPIQSAHRAKSDTPSSPHPVPAGYYPAASHTSTPNHLNSYHSPEPPSSPPSITLYPVPQAPRNHSIPPWPPQNISPEPVPHRHSTRDASSSRSGSSRRKRGKDNDKKPPLACLFCRGRKIACGPPVPDGDGKTCNQCHRRSLKCDYPAESRRGMRKDKSLPNLIAGGGGAKVILKSRKR